MNGRALGLSLLRETFPQRLPEATNVNDFNSTPTLYIEPPSLATNTLVVANSEGYYTTPKRVPAHDVPEVAVISGAELISKCWPRDSSFTSHAQARSFSSWEPNSDFGKGTEVAHGSYPPTGRVRFGDLFDVDTGTELPKAGDTTTV